VNASHYRDLEVWQLAMQLAKRVYELTATFPREERYGLSSQMQRAAVSIPSNIAEGNARGTTRDYARFVSMASGSAAELITQLLVCRDLELGDADTLSQAVEQTERVSQMLFRLRRSLEQRLHAGSRVAGPGSRVPSPESR
jgi:four helix bundle protein